MLDSITKRQLPRDAPDRLVGRGARRLGTGTHLPRVGAARHYVTEKPLLALGVTLGSHR